ncbi:MAG: glycosyltransferase family 10 [Lachnospiraceae bacterium]|nr:glycosyltransferase family 10 [Lachnospiraceae bacterium]
MSTGRELYRRIKRKAASIRANAKIYKPYYNTVYGINSQIPPIYNKEGEPMELFFIRDMHTAHNPYGNVGKHFLWDRYNWGLETHFYTHKAMLETMGHPARKYGMFGESRVIVPKDYEIFQKHKGLEREFNAVFTFDEQLLNALPNAKFYPLSAEVWYGKDCPEVVVDTAYQNKSKNVSIVCSDKQMCEQHRVRMSIARYCKDNHKADVMGKFDGGSYVTTEESLQAYRYSFAIENEITDYYFTERLTSCFAAQTIPIYMGARKIDEFFNPDGIIKITKKDLDCLDKVLAQCTEAEYEIRLPAVLENYERVQCYRNMQDYLYERLL